jgi:hypothetical protein
MADQKKMTQADYDRQGREKAAAIKAALLNTNPQATETVSNETKETPDASTPPVDQAAPAAKSDDAPVADGATGEAPGSESEQPPANDSANAAGDESTSGNGTASETGLINASAPIVGSEVPPAKSGYTAADGPTAAAVDAPAGDVETAVADARAEAAAAGPAVLQEAPASTVSASLQAKSASDTLLQTFGFSMDDYIAKMGKAVPVNPTDGAGHQLRLYRLLIQILKQEGSVFNKAWGDFLARVHAEREGAFHELRVFRFFSSLKQLEVKEQRVFQNLLHLAIHTADPKARQLGLKSMDLASVTKDIPVANAADKIHGYYAP